MIYRDILETLDRSKKQTIFELYAYYLMANHVHLPIRGKEVEISKILKKSIEKARDIIREIGNLTNISDMKKLDKEKRNRAVVCITNTQMQYLSLGL